MCTSVVLGSEGGYCIRNKEGMPFEDFFSDKEIGNHDLTDFKDNLSERGCVLVMMLILCVR